MYDDGSQAVVPSEAKIVHIDGVVEAPKGI